MILAILAYTVPSVVNLFQTTRTRARLGKSAMWFITFAVPDAISGGWNVAAKIPVRNKLLIGCQIRERLKYFKDPLDTGPWYGF